MDSPAYIDVLLPLPVYGTFTYSVNGDQAGTIKTGMRVIVPFGKKKTTPGYVLMCISPGLRSMM